MVVFINSLGKKGASAWIKSPKKDMAVTFSYSVPPALPSKWCITCDTYANITQGTRTRPLAEPCPSSHHPQPWLLTIHKARRRFQLSSFLFFFGGSVSQVGLWLGLVSFFCKQVSKQAYILQANAHSLMQALHQAHQEHQAHTSSHKLSEARTWKVWASCPCFDLCLSILRSFTLRSSWPLSSTE